MIERNEVARDILNALDDNGMVVSNDHRDFGTLHEVRTTACQCDLCKDFKTDVVHVIISALCHFNISEIE